MVISAIAVFLCVMGDLEPFGAFTGYVDVKHLVGLDIAHNLLVLLPMCGLKET